MKSVNNRNRFLKSAISVFCAAFLLYGTVSAQQLPVFDVPSPASPQALNVLSTFFVGTDTEEEKRFYQLTKMTSKAFENGEIENAKSYAKSLLEQAEKIGNKNWNYGNALHVANFTLGRIALVDGKTDEAKRYLLESGKTPGSPQLNSFGPNMVLAKELLEKEEREAVIQYFELCAKFWKEDDGKLNAWKTKMLNGEMPDFGANLRYQL